ncbi:hypothetical protein FRZ06_10085 [Anoxybacterium hadale]|uniref:Uncharacterized protein n=1 Tax=Anoxybacterium hadale TaxID=3408580 RepID=A0ACD1ABY3_9FIRM|nr:hypothetical protein FRZ06_10085 [Clostridiales bacterium]
MLNEIKQSIKDKLTALFPPEEGYALFDEKVPEGSEKPYFLLLLTKQTYSKKLKNKYQSILYFDLGYYSNLDTAENKKDLMRVQEILVRSFDSAGTYRVRNKSAQIIEQVLHVTFDISYSEMKVEEAVSMQQIEATTSV